jgi:hypothetical protein
MSMTSREAYAAMLKDVISPRLRAAGFKGSSGSYVWPSDTHWIQVGFQKMTGFDPVVRFTVNLTVISKPDWETIRHRYPGTGARPAPTASFSAEDSHWWDRLTGYVPEQDLREDGEWWRVSTETDIATLGDEVADLIATYGLPVLLHRAAHDAASSPGARAASSRVR